MFMPRVELLADSDFEPAAVPRVDGLNLLGAAGRQKLCLHSRDIPEVLLCLLVQVVTKNGQPLFRYISVRSQRTGIEKALLLMHTWYIIDCNPSVEKGHPRDDLMALSHPET